MVRAWQWWAAPTPSRWQTRPCLPEPTPLRPQGLVLAKASSPSKLLYSGPLRGSLSHLPSRQLADVVSQPWERSPPWALLTLLQVRAVCSGGRQGAVFRVLAT